MIRFLTTILTLASTVGCDSGAGGSDVPGQGGDPLSLNLEAALVTYSVQFPSPDNARSSRIAVAPYLAPHELVFVTEEASAFYSPRLSNGAQHLLFQGSRKSGTAFMFAFDDSSYGLVQADGNILRIDSDLTSWDSDDSGVFYTTTGGITGGGGFFGFFDRVSETANLVARGLVVHDVLDKDTLLVQGRFEDEPSNSFGLASPDGAELTPLHNDHLRDRSGWLIINAAWSRGQRLIAYEFRHRSLGHSLVAVTDLTGSFQRILSRVGEDARRPEWGPDGRLLYTSVSTSGGDVVFRIRVSDLRTRSTENFLQPEQIPGAASVWLGNAVNPTQE